MKKNGGESPLRQGCTVLCPVLLYLLLGFGLRALLFRAGLGLDEEAAGAVSACVLLIPVALWYVRQQSGCEKQRHCPRTSRLRMAVLLAAAMVCLSLTAAWVARHFAAAAPASVSVLPILGFGIAAPITEEILYRGIVFRRCEAYFGASWAMLLSVVLFGVAHQPLANACMSLVAGLLFCLIYVRWRTLLAPIAVHIGANLIAFAEPETYLPEGILLLGLLGLAGMLTLLALPYLRENKR